MPTAPYLSEEELFTRGANSNRRSKSAPSLNRPKPKRVVSKRGGGLLPYTAPIESSESLPQDNTERVPPAPTEPLYPPLNLTREKMRVDEERRNIPAPPAPKPSVTHRAVAPPTQRAPPPPRQQQQQMQQQQRKPPPAGGSNHRTFKLTDFEMPWTIIKVGFRYHTSLGQLEKIFFYLFRFSLTITWGLAIYGSATGDQGGDGAFSPEDQKLWECDTKKPVCEVICFNRFQPVMPARFLLVTMLITVMPDIFFMLAFAKTDAAVKRVTQAKQSMKTISDDKKAKWEAKASSYKQDTLKTNLYLGKAGQLTWSSEASHARLACQVAKFVLDVFFFFAFNWLLQVPLQDNGIKLLIKVIRLNMINIYPHTSSTTVNHGMCTIHVQSCHPSTTNARPEVSTRVAAQIRARVTSKLSRVTIRAIMKKR